MNTQQITTISTDPEGDALRLKALLEKHRDANQAYSQASFAAQHGLGSQAKLWQMLNPGNAKGRPLNLAAAIAFANGLKCSVADFSPSLQNSIDLISQFRCNFSVNEKSSNQYLYTAQTDDEKQLLLGYRSAESTRREDMLDLAKKSLRLKENAA